MQFLIPTPSNGPKVHLPDTTLLRTNEDSSFPPTGEMMAKTKIQLILEMFDIISIGLRLKASSPSIKSNIEARLFRRRNS